MPVHKSARAVHRRCPLLDCRCLAFRGTHVVSGGRAGGARWQWRCCVQFSAAPALGAASTDSSLPGPLQVQGWAWW